MWSVFITFFYPLVFIYLQMISFNPPLHFVSPKNREYKFKKNSDIFWHLYYFFENIKIVSN